MLRAEIIAIGSEMLTPYRSDTNSLFLTRSLDECGIEVVAKTIVGDGMTDIATAFDVAFQRSDVIIATGGLGPTVDDLTREALCKFLDLELPVNSEILERIEQRFRKYNVRMPEINRKQAMVPAGATWIPNDHGTAPGIFLETRGKQVFLLPGPPFEMEAMWRKYGINLVRNEQPLQRQMFRIAMMPESQVDEALQPVSSALQNVKYTILSAPSEIEIHLLAPPSAVDELISVSAEIRAILKEKIFTEEFETLETVVGRLLVGKKKTVSVAESCSGGLLAGRLTNVPGSSSYFERGIVTYSNQAKTELLGVPSDLIATHGAVSEQVARYMAEGIRKMTNTDYGISITGIAGPDGGTEEKPVGTVYIGLSDSNQTSVQHYRLYGDRARVRFSSTQAALNLLRLRLL